MGKTKDGPAGLANLLPLLAGAAVTFATAGAVMALTGADTPVRPPLTLFFLVAGPALALGAALTGLPAGARFALSVSGAVAADLLVAQTLLVLDAASARTGTAAVAGLTALCGMCALRAPAHRRRRRKQCGTRESGTPGESVDS